MVKDVGSPENEAHLEVPNKAVFKFCISSILLARTLYIVHFKRKAKMQRKTVGHHHVKIRLTCYSTIILTNTAKYDTY